MILVGLTKMIVKKRAHQPERHKMQSLDTSITSDMLAEMSASVSPSCNKLFHPMKTQHG